MGFMDPIVSINKSLWRRIEMIVCEVEYMQSGEELRGIELEEECQDFVRKIVDEYIRQYFEESTRSVAELLTRRIEQQKTEPRFWLK